MLLSAFTGDQNFPTGSSKLHLFFVPTRNHMGQELHVGIMAKGANPNVPITSSNVRRFAAMNGAPETLGRWTQANYEIPDGVVLKLFASKRASMQGQRLTQHMAVIYVQARSQGAMNSIGFNLIPHERSPINRAEMQGRFDILSVRELAQMGVSLNPSTLVQMDDAHVNRLFSITTLERQLQSRPAVRTTTMRNSEGETIAIQKTVTKRAVKL